MRYQQYIDSKVNWIGLVPNDWQRTRIKFGIRRSAAGVWGNDEKGNSDDVICFRIADFDYPHGELKLDNITLRNIEKNQLEGRLLSYGDLLIEKSGGGDATPVGRVVRVNYEGKATCSNFIHSLTLNEKLDNNFMYYYFHFLYSNKVNLLFFNQTTGLQNLKVSDYLSQSIYVPTIDEQKAIANYLGIQSAKIDNVIAAQEKRVELLQELKQSIITRAVTRGIDPDVKLKDSGVEWIGQIPEHWEVQKLRNISKTITDYVASGSFADLRNNVQYLDEPDFALLVRTTDLSKKNKDVHPVYVSRESYNFLSNSNLYGGEIILRNIGASIGDVYMVPNGLYDKMTLGPNAILLRTRYIDKYYYYFFSSKYGRESLALLGQAAAQSKFNKTELRQMKVVLPPVYEQETIVRKIEQKILPVDKSISKARYQIDLLKEYKQSLITEVVTGKRKVS